VSPVYQKKADLKRWNIKYAHCDRVEERPEEFHLAHMGTVSAGCHQLEGLFLMRIDEYLPGLLQRTILRAFCTPYSFPVPIKECQQMVVQVVTSSRLTERFALPMTIIPDLIRDSITSASFDAVRSFNA
jgi:hypothetical protein